MRRKKAGRIRSVLRAFREPTEHRMDSVGKRIGRKYWEEAESYARKKPPAKSSLEEMVRDIERTRVPMQLLKKIARAYAVASGRMAATQAIRLVGVKDKKTQKKLYATTREIASRVLEMAIAGSLSRAPDDQIVNARIRKILKLLGPVKGRIFVNFCMRKLSKITKYLFESSDYKLG